jgi:hypothetical protein
MKMHSRVLAVAGGTAALVMLASPSYAHDCFNPQKDRTRRRAASTTS